MHRLLIPLSAASRRMASCKHDVQWSCCTDPGRCETIRSCDYWNDPAHTFCDMDGTTAEAMAADGAKGICVADPVNPGCEGPADCSGATPACFEEEHVCVECLDDSTCNEVSSPVCNTGEHECRGCMVTTNARPRRATHCNEGAGTCVACTDSVPAQSTGQAQICDATSNACRACRPHGSCPSQLCGDDGACVVADQIIYVDASGLASGPPCAQGAKCKTIGEAFTKAAGRTKMVVAAGAYTEMNGLDLDDPDMIMFGAGAATTSLAPTVTTEDVVKVTGAGSLEIRGLRIFGAGMNNDGVNCGRTRHSHRSVAKRHCRHQRWPRHRCAERLRGADLGLDDHRKCRGGLSLQRQL